MKHNIQHVSSKVTCEEAVFSDGNICLACCFCINLFFVIHLLFLGDWWMLKWQQMFSTLVESDKKCWCCKYGGPLNLKLFGPFMYNSDRPKNWMNFILLEINQMWNLTSWHWLMKVGKQASVVHQCLSWSGIITAAKSVIGVIFKNKDVIKVTDVARG